MDPFYYRYDCFDKSNLTNIPQYPMNWFRIPIYVCKNINNLNKNFFWNDNCNNNSGHHTIHTISWDKIYRPKCEGGLDIRKAEDSDFSSKIRSENSDSA